MLRLPTVRAPVSDRRVWMRAAVKPLFTNWAQNDVSPITWVISLNLKRRHLVPGQRAAVAVEAKALLAGEAKKHLATSGPGFRGGKVETLFLKNEKGDTKPIHVEKTVAKQFDVSQGYVHAALLFHNVEICPAKVPFETAFLNAGQVETPSEGAFLLYNSCCERGHLVYGHR